VSRKTSPETELRRIRAAYNRLLKDHRASRDAVLRLTTAANNAIKERDEWKFRFDLLLSKTEAVKP
jgi:hypothetical protein